jgi:hypothetical protein
VDLNHIQKTFREMLAQVLISVATLYVMGHAVAQWLRRYATNRKVTGSIPNEVNF